MIPDAGELRLYLSGLDYPSDRGSLVEHVRRRGAGDDVVRRLDALPNRAYYGPDTVTREYVNT
jgi:Protein of unknown function (DUF2795)